MITLLGRGADGKTVTNKTEGDHTESNRASEQRSGGSRFIEGVNAGED
ncbi:MAG: hypothetical protein AAGG44_09190 [Planctomycetota bacterium]